VGRDPLKIEDHQINIKAIQTIIKDVGHYAYCGLNLSKSCVVGTFEFLISAHTNPKPTTLGIPLGGQPDKTRQLARQVGGASESAGELDGSFQVPQSHAP
jgi:hypothetical protein